MGKVDQMIEQARKDKKEKGKQRQTKNKDQHLEMLIAVLTDDEYVAKDLACIKDGEIIIEEKRFAPRFKELVVAPIFRKGGMSQEEAMEAATNFKVTKTMAAVIVDSMRETDYIILEEFGKKIQLFKKPELDSALTIVSVNETKKRNPQDPTKLTVIKPRRKCKVHNEVHPWMKDSINV